MADPTMNCWSMSYVAGSDGNSKNIGLTTVEAGLVSEETGRCAL